MISTSHLRKIAFGSRQMLKEFFLDFYNKGLFKEVTSEQYFDEEKKVFLADRYIVGICPNCGYDIARGDQCDKCGRTLDPKELIGIKCRLSGDTPEIREQHKVVILLEGNLRTARNALSCLICCV